MIADRRIQADALQIRIDRHVQGLEQHLPFAEADIQIFLDLFVNAAGIGNALDMLAHYPFFDLHVLAVLVVMSCGNPAAGA